MKQHVVNAAFGIADYLAFPLGMLAVAPIVLRHLGAAQYGIWSVAISVVTIGSVAACGLGDANIQRVSVALSAGDTALVRRLVSNTYSIHLVLGLALALVGVIASPTLADHLSQSAPSLRGECLLCLRIASVLIFIRAVESVCVSTQRAYQRYGESIRLSVIARLLSLAFAGLLSAYHFTIPIILAVTAFITGIAAIWQFRQLSQLLNLRWVTPSFDRESFHSIVGFGLYTWFQALFSVLIAQVDRIFLGLSLGVEVVAAYALCIQITQPLYGLLAAGLHFLFPYFASRPAQSGQTARHMLWATLSNLLIAGAGAAILLLFGESLLRVWASPQIARYSAGVLPYIVISTALAGAGVTATYALLSLERPRTVMLFNLCGGMTTLTLMVLLLTRLGVRGLAISRLAYGAANLMLYLPLIVLLTSKGQSLELCEEVR